MPTAYIALGANLPSSIGPPEATLARAVARLSALGRVAARSSLYSTAPVGFADQPRFLNAVVALVTDLSPHELLSALLSLERAFGRDRDAVLPNGPRTLDLDILLYGDFVLSEVDLVIPHPRLAERAFVLIPLHEIAPHAVDPRSGKTAGELLKSLSLPAETALRAVVPVASDLWRTARVGSKPS